MGKRGNAVLIVVAGAAVAMLAGPNGPLGSFWRPTELDPEPAGAQLAGLIGAGLIEAIGFGVALAILVLGRPLFTRITTTGPRTTVAWLTAAWLLGSWWPHTALHMHYGLKAAALVGLELGFHAGSILAFALLLWAVIPGGRSWPAEAPPTSARVLGEDDLHLR